MQPGDLIAVEVDKAVAGGRMLARHLGQIVFVAGAIPGERIRARISRVTKSALYADVDEVLSPSTDRRATVGDGRCGGNVLSHIAPDRQIRLKGEILEDAFRRVARLPLDATPPVIASPELGYRMRARIHARGNRLGFLREGSHDLCDVAATGQLLPAAVSWISYAEEVLGRAGLHGVQSIELAENVAASERACHIDVAVGEDVHRYGDLAQGLTGLSVQAGTEPVQLSGRSSVTDRLVVTRHQTEAALTLNRDVRAFFQGNRHLLHELVSYVAGLVPDGPIVDLYAGVGLFGLSLAALGQDEVTHVEGDRISGANLVSNAVPFGAGIQVRRMSVEQFLRADSGRGRHETVIADPPRTGLSPEALGGLVRRLPARLVYISCDVATLARDARGLVDAGYHLERLQGFDLFPNTAHVESVALFVR